MLLSDYGIPPASTSDTRVRKTADGHKTKKQLMVAKPQLFYLINYFFILPFLSYAQR